MCYLNKKYSINEIDEYSALLNAQYAKESEEYLFNDSIVQAISVMSCFFEKCNDIKMYCECMFLFSKATETKLKEKLESPDISDTLIQHFDNIIQTFLNKKEAHLTVICEKNSLNLRESIRNIFEINKNKIKISTTNGLSISPFHFTIGDERCLRKENSHPDKTAFVNMNAGEECRILSTAFGQVLACTSSISSF